MKSSRNCPDRQSQNEQTRKDAEYLVRGNDPGDNDPQNIDIDDHKSKLEHTQQDPDQDLKKPGRFLIDLDLRRQDPASRQAPHHQYFSPEDQFKLFGIQKQDNKDHGNEGKGM